MSKKKKKKKINIKKNNIYSSQQYLGSRFFKRNSSYIFLLFLICIVFFYKIVFGFASVKEDLLFLEFPHRIFAKDSFQNFRFPHWNPYTFNGMPFFAAFSSIFYPFNFLLSILPVNQVHYWYLFQLEVLIHYFIAGLSMYIYIQGRNLTKLASFFAAIGYMLCGFLVARQTHPSILMNIVWIPLVFFFIEKSINKNRYIYMLIAGLVFGMMMHTGHPQIILYEFIFIGFYSTFLLFQKRDKKIKRLIQITSLFLIAIGVVAVNILPTLEMVDQSTRSDWTFQQASEASIPIFQLIALFMPKIFGARTTPDIQIPAFWLKSSFHSGSWTYWETCFYMGIAILVLAIYQFKNIKKMLLFYLL